MGSRPEGRGFHGVWGLGGGVFSELVCKGKKEQILQCLAINFKKVYVATHRTIYYKHSLLNQNKYFSENVNFCELNTISQVFFKSLQILLL